MTWRIDEFAPTAAGLVVVRFSGGFDFESHRESRATIEALIAKDPEGVVCDLAGMKYLNEVAFGSDARGITKTDVPLLELHRRRNERGRWIACAAAPRKVTVMLEMLGLGKFMRFYPSVAEAEAAFSARDSHR